MHLDSVRELKQRVIRSVLARMVAASSHALGLAYAASTLDAMRQPRRLLAVGVAPGGKGQFRLAVRLQRRSLAASAELERLRSMARGELDVRFIGSVQKRARPWHQGRNRPLKIGGSVANFAVTAGTVGGFVRQRGRTEVHILSNNHVLANENQARPGDAVLQPGPYDGGTRARDRVARLERFVRLQSPRVNLVDCAIARLLPGIEYDAARLTGWGTLRGVSAAPVDEGMRVVKVGRTTGVTRGRVTAFELDDVVVAYDMGNLRFDDQIEIEGSGNLPFSDGGDSGSLIVDGAGYAVGQLFAGSDTGGRNNQGLTYASPIRTVLDRLNVQLVF